jgi:spore coat-associated protein N
MKTRKILASLVAVCGVSIAAAGGTYANFAATPTTIGSNAFATGTVSMNRSGSGAILSLPAMKIGDAASGSVTISNTGSLASVYSLSGATTGSAVLADQLRLVIYKDVDGDAGAKLYDGPLSGFTSAALGTFAASGSEGDAHTFYFHVSLETTGSDAGDNALQGLSATASFTWSAVAA